MAKKNQPAKPKPIQALTVAVSKLSLGPNDVLLVKLPGKPEEEYAREVFDAVKDLVGDGRFLLYRGDILFTVVEREEATELDES